MFFRPMQKGQGLVEYAIIILMIALVVIVVLGLFGESLANSYMNVVNAI